MLFALLSYVAEQEIKKRYQRQMEGQAVARARGKHMGRPKYQVPPNFQEICREWRDGEITAVEAMRRAGMKKTSFYKITKGGDPIDEFTDHQRLPCHDPGLAGGELTLLLGYNDGVERYLYGNTLTYRPSMYPAIMTVEAYIAGCQSKIYTDR